MNQGGKQIAHTENETTQTGLRLEEVVNFLIKPNLHLVSKKKLPGVNILLYTKYIFLSFADIWIHLVLLTVFIHTCCGHLQLSHESIIKHVGDTFLVTCKDVSGRTVEWSGPKGPLGLKTEPRVAVASYGTSLYFNGLNVKDAGVYTCKAGEETKKFSLTVKSKSFCNYLWKAYFFGAIGKVLWPSIKMGHIKHINLNWR